MLQPKLDKNFDCTNREIAEKRRKPDTQETRNKMNA